MVFLKNSLKTINFIRVFNEKKNQNLEVVDRPTIRKNELFEQNIRENTLF